MRSKKMRKKEEESEVISGNQKIEEKESRKKRMRERERERERERMTRRCRGR